MIKINSVLKWQSLILITIIVSIFLYLIFDSNIPLLFSIFCCGIPLVYEIGSKIIHGDLGADILAALAVITSVILGEYLAGNIVLLMLASGQVLEFYALRRASAVLSALAKRMPNIAHIKEGKNIKDIKISDIKIGDHIVIYPHETCPVDGHVIEGFGSMDESFLTGEPYEISKAPGVHVISGSINGDSLLTIVAEKLPEDSRYARIVKVMEESEQRRPKLRRLSDQLGAVFAPIALVGAIVAWTLSGDPIRFLAVLVIATPCPLLIAIPITIISAISKAAQRGIIVRDPLVLERLPTCRTAIFDKTGTLTYGKAELEEIKLYGKYNEEELLQLVASVERFSKHPLAKAILRAAHERKITLLDVEKVTENPGQGVLGKIGKNNIEITTRQILKKENKSLLKLIPNGYQGMESIVLINSKLEGIVYFRDSLRTEGLSFIRHLTPQHQFKKIMIVSGDRLEEVERLAKELHIRDIKAGQSPEQKVEIVELETKQNPTLFMGDGINDAPALAVATVGLAFGHENIVATEAAGAVILESSLSKVDELLHISTVMRQAAIISGVGGMLLSFIGMYFAGIGLIKPVMGAILQEVIDVISIMVALQLTYQKNTQSDIREI
jgi:heavy metal translocating P-type ATPase